MIFAKEIEGEPVKVTRREVNQYINNPIFGFFLDVYQYTKLWGMPNGNGWANENLTVLEGITALEIESKCIEAEEIDASTE